MQINSSDQTRKKLYEEYEDSLFRLVMHDAAEKEGKLFLEEKEKLKNDPEYKPSPDEIKKFSRQLDTQLKKPKADATRQRVLKSLNRVAVAMLLVIVILFTTVASVQALRVRVLNFIMNIQPEYTSFHLKESDSASNGGSSIVNWTKAYVPTYIPDGYEVSNTSNSEMLKKIVFQNQQNKDLIIVYTELGEASSPGVDTEDASSFKTISINGQEGTLVEKNSFVTIVWQIDNRLFTVQAPTSEDIAIKIAQGVKYKN